MTKKEILALVEYLMTTEGMSEGGDLSAAVKNGKRTAEDLTDREIVLLSCVRWADFERVMLIGGDDEIGEAIKLAREAMSTEKSFHAWCDMNEGVFKSDKDAENYAKGSKCKISLS